MKLMSGWAWCLGWCLIFRRIWALAVCRGEYVFLESVKYANHIALYSIKMAVGRDRYCLVRLNRFDYRPHWIYPTRFVLFVLRIQWNLHKWGRLESIFHFIRTLKSIIFLRKKIFGVVFKRLNLLITILRVWPILYAFLDPLYLIH